MGNFLAGRIAHGPIKIKECWRTDAFQLQYWRRCLRVLWTAKRSNQSILKEINPEYSLESLMLKPKLQTFTWYEEQTHQKRPWCWERLRAGGKGGDRGWDGWMASPTQWTRVWAGFRRRWRTGRPGELQSMESQRVGYDHQLNSNNKTIKDRASSLTVTRALQSDQLNTEFPSSSHPKIQGVCVISSASPSFSGKRTSAIVNKHLEEIRNPHEPHAWFAYCLTMKR